MTYFRNSSYIIKYIYLIFQDISEGDIGRCQPIITSMRLITFGSVVVNIEKKIRFNRFQVSGIDE